MPNRVSVTERDSISQSAGTVCPSHWMSQPADNAATRRFRISQPENSTYSGWRLISAVRRTNSASTIMPPSSRPDWRWYCSTDKAYCSVCHCTTLTRAGPEKVPLHSICDGRLGMRRAKPALAALIAPPSWPRLASPSGRRETASQHPIASAWRDGNSMTPCPAAAGGGAKLNQIG